MQSSFIASVCLLFFLYFRQNASGSCCSLDHRTLVPDHCLKVRCNGLEGDLNQCEQTDAKNSYCWQYDVSVKCLSGEVFFNSTNVLLFFIKLIKTIFLHFLNFQNCSHGMHVLISPRIGISWINQKLDISVKFFFLCLRYFTDT